MRNGKHLISVFGSAAPAAGTSLYQLAYDLGFSLARSGLVVCNGGYGGIMEASAKGAHDGGGASVGITARFYSSQANPWINEAIEAETPVDRLLRLVHEGSGYVFLPGGTGTLLELAAVLEFTNKAIISPRPAVLLGNFWGDVVSTVNREPERESRMRLRTFLVQADTPDECVNILTTSLKAGT